MPQVKLLLILIGNIDILSINGAQTLKFVINDPETLEKIGVFGRHG